MNDYTHNDTSYPLLATGLDTLGPRHGLCLASDSHSRPPPMAGNDFTFVSQSGHADQDTQATNKFVRSHVMRAYKRQQKAMMRKGSDKVQSAKTTSPSRGPESSDGYSDLTSPSTDITSLTETTRASLPRQTEGTGRGQETFAATMLLRRYSHPQTWLDGVPDPFASLPIQMNRRSFTLLQQIHTPAGLTQSLPIDASAPLRTSVHADPDGSYRRTCSKDPAWLFMHLYYAVQRFAQQNHGAKAKSEVEAAQYLSRSQSAIGKSISESPCAIDDSTIAAVACLANIENLNGRSATACVHMNGLKRMVQIRGGLSNLGIHGTIRRMVLSDLLTSLSLKIPPHFPLVHNESLKPLWEFVPAGSQVWLARYHQVTEDTLPVMLDTITTRSHCISISHLLVTMHQLAVFLAAHNDCEVLPLAADYPDRVYEVEHNLSLALYDDQVIVADTGDDRNGESKVQVGQLLLHAALLFVYSHLRQTPVGGPIRAALLSRLVGLMNGMDLVRLSLTFKSAVIWALLVGVSATPHPNSLLVKALRQCRHKTEMEIAEN
ncbi:hypothetical protein Micbo1qcDRAFT_214983 [Microdochium bolleyi]|uniref:Uncharacterized protein n=1 Tax=Microdochium bolleyi TaxID=196109 RepID=A0A136IU53_9PEZI|nr:hypothetical protein Micbo1qcDRAFT_214983 [Microdochium bolleyi]